MFDNKENVIVTSDGKVYNKANLYYRPMVTNVAQVVTKLPQLSYGWSETTFGTRYILNGVTYTATQV